MPLIGLIVFLRVEHAADGWLHAEHREEVAGDHLRLDPLRLVVDAHRGVDQAAGTAPQIAARRAAGYPDTSDRSASAVPCCCPYAGPAWYSITSCSGAVTGSLRSSIWSMRVNIAVLAPMPSASDRIATVAKRGFRRSPRRASRRSAIGAKTCSFFDGTARLTVYGSCGKRLRATRLEKCRVTYTWSAREDGRGPRARRGTVARGWPTVTAKATRIKVSV